MTAHSGNVAIRLEHVSKEFTIRRDKSLKERLVNAGRSRRHAEHFVALDDVSFDVPTGSTVGLIGHNGSGKSTLLKLVGGILRPTSGSVRHRGRIAALLELGAGFHGDLTGRENVYLNASLLGLSRAQTDKHFDDIVEFSEIPEKIDTQVKFYSSGQYVRLAFAVAVHVDPEILLVDEVLAVGDEPFQRKCLDRIRTFQAEGRTMSTRPQRREQRADHQHRAEVMGGRVAGVDAHRVAAVGALDGDQPRGDVVKRLVPPDALPSARIAPEREADSLGIGVDISQRVALRADMAAREHVVVVAAYRDHLAVHVPQLQPTHRLAQRASAVVQARGRLCAWDGGRHDSSLSHTVEKLPTGSAHQVKGHDRRGPRHHAEGSMSTAKPDIVTPEQWRAARESLLKQEKAHTRARDALAAERRRMPMIRVEKDYRFTAPGGGDATLLDLFDGSRQLVVYRFFMDPDLDVYPERSAWSFLDITPYGRQEEWEDSPEDWPQTPPYTWGGWHDRYDHTL